MKLKSVFENRVGLFVLFTIILITISFLLRTLLLIKSAGEIDFTARNIVGIFFIGLLSDIITAAYTSIPLVVYLWLMPERIFRRPGHQYTLFMIFIMITFSLIFNGIAEWFFWDEFSARFNFIAVDYLVYTTEVIGNINQSYPIAWLIFITILVSALTVYLLYKTIKRSDTRYMPFRKRSMFVSMYAIIVVVIFFAFTNKYHRFSYNAYVNELAGNGLYELFSAYRHNELGQLIAVGFNSNYGQRKNAKYIFLSATLDAAIWGAELTKGDGRERIYLVEPTGLIENDPDLTDKKFPGNPSQSYRSTDPFKVVGEVTVWQGHLPEQVKMMKEHLERLKEQGISSLND